MRRINKAVLPYFLVLTLLAVPSFAAWYDGNFTNILLKGFMDIPELSSVPDAPDTTAGRFYTYNDGLYFQDDAGSATNLLAGTSTSWSDIGDPTEDTTITFADNEITVFSLADTNEDMFTIKGIGAFGDVSVVRIEQATGAATDGTVLEVVAADSDVDPLVVSASGKANALVVGQDTGVVTIAGVAEATSALIITAGDLLISDGDIHVDAGDALFDEDVDVVGDLTLTGDLVGGTGLINYDNFDVDASGNVAAVGGTFSGNVSAVDGTFSGNMSVTGTFQQDALAPASPGAVTITLDGSGTGGVSIGTVAGTGAITLGGSATAVNLPSTVDLTLAGGDLTITDTANADMVTFTNNTMTTADLLTLTAGGTRTSDNVVEIADSATTATTMGITANAQTSGNGIHYSNSGAALTGAALRMDITDGGGFTGQYILGYDGSGQDFAFKRYGELEIAGLANTDMLTVTTGHIQVDDGMIEVDTDEDHSSNVTRNFNGVGSGAAFAVVDTHTSTTNSALSVTAAGAAATGATITASGTNNSTGLAVVHSGDFPTLKLTAGAARTGDVVDIVMANQLAEKAINIDGAWTGTAGEGMIDLYTPAQIVATASMLRIDMDTAQADDASDGYGINIDDDSLVAANPVVYAALIDSNANGALHVSKGVSLFADIVTFTAGVTSNGNTILGDAITDDITAGGAFLGATPIILDGTTDDTTELTIGVTDPTSDTTITLPDGPSSGNIASIVSVGTTQTSQAGVGTSTVTGSSIAVPSGHAAAGQVYTWEISGTKTGANNAMIVKLQLANDEVMTLTASDAAAGDWVARFKCYLTGAGTQDIQGELLVNGKVGVMDFATGATDISGAVNIFAEIESQNGGDTVTAETVTVTYNE